jgi:large subunit ribosomal protein L16
MLSPKRTKYRKAHKGRIHGLAKGGTTLNFGAFGLKALEPARVTAACRVKPGRIMFEIDGVSPAVAKEAFDLAAAKLPIKTSIVRRLGEGEQ